MRYFSYNEPIWDDNCIDGVYQIKGNRVITVSEDHIRRTYFPYWKKRVEDTRGIAAAAEYTFEDCLMDFIVLYWAWEVTPAAAWNSIRTGMKL